MASAPAKVGSVSITGITKTYAVVRWSAPASGGAKIDYYQVQADNTSNFSSPIHDKQSVDLSEGLTETLAPNTRYYCRVRAHNSAGWGAWSSTVSFTTLPNLPTAPGMPTVTRQSDTKQQLSWTINPSSSGPYVSQQVQRTTVVDGTTGTFATIATVGAGTTAYTDQTTAAGAVYRYRVAAVNASGSASGGQSAWVHTTPKAPTGMKATLAATGVLLFWLVMSHDQASRTVVQHSGDGGATWQTLGTTTSQQTFSWIHTNPGPNTAHLYRAQAVVQGTTTDPGYGLASGWTQSNAVGILAAPYAPTDMNPNGAAFDGTADIQLAWVHNSADTSAQRQLAVRHRVQGGADWTTESTVTQAESSWVLPAGTYPNGVVVEWQVATWGLSDQQSPWSATATIVLDSTPTVTINTPADGDTVNMSTLDVAWGYYQAEGITCASVHVHVVDADSNLIADQTISGDATGWTLTGLTDATAYTIDVTAISAAGQASNQDSADFTTSFIPPAPVTIDAQFQEDSGVVVLALTPGDADGTTAVDVVAATVERSADGGVTWTPLTDGQIDPGSTMVDPTCPLTTAVLYRAVGVSDLPSTAPGPQTTPAGLPTVWCFLSGGAAFDQVVRLWGNPTISTSDTLERALQQFEGRILPVEMAGTAVTATLDFQGLLTDDGSSPDDMRALARVPGPMLWRDPTGRRFYGSISAVKIDERNPSPASHTISFTLTQLDDTGIGTGLVDVSQVTLPGFGAGGFGV